MRKLLKLMKCLTAIVVIFLFIGIHTGRPHTEKSVPQPTPTTHTILTVRNDTSLPVHKPVVMEVPSYYNRHSVDVVDLKRIISGNIYKCIILKINPPIPMCIYDDGDRLSATLAEEKIYEEQLTQVIISLLATDRSMGLINIGAGIGYYNLIAAGLGHPGIAVEPLPYNIARIRASAHMGLTQNSIIVLRNGVSNTHNIQPVYFNDSDIGGATLTNAHISCKKKKGGCPVTKTIYLDDLCPFISFPKAILKLDISGYEARVFQQAQVLFDKVDVSYVLMKSKAISVHCIANPDILKGMFNFFGQRQYTPSNAITGEKLEPRECSLWDGDVLWTKKK